MAKYSERKNTRSSSGSAGGPTTKKAKDTKEETSSEIIKRHQDEAIENLRKGRKIESEVDGGCDDEDIINDRRFDILFTAVRVLIDTNNEIYERCKQYCKKMTTDGEIRFYRIGYFTVKVWKDDDEKKEMNVGSTLEVELEDFKNFTCLPSELNDLGFKAADDVDSILDGYEKYFRTITFFYKTTCISISYDLQEAFTGCPGRIGKHRNMDYRTISKFGFYQRAIRHKS